MNRKNFIRSAKALFVLVAMFGMLPGTVGCASSEDCCGKCQQGANCGPNCKEPCCKKTAGKCGADCNKPCCRKG